MEKQAPQPTPWQKDFPDKIWGGSAWRFLPIVSLDLDLLHAELALAPHVQRVGESIDLRAHLEIPAGKYSGSVVKTKI